MIGWSSNPAGMPALAAAGSASAATSSASPSLRLSAFLHTFNPDT